tara:strand:+ start:557 stop:688 length:132 start_codon:yes stop_codon:yes gene_type:complete
MRKQVGTPEILKKSHAHKSKKDYARQTDKQKLKKEVKNLEKII